MAKTLRERHTFNFSVRDLLALTIFVALFVGEHGGLAASGFRLSSSRLQYYIARTVQWRGRTLCEWNRLTT